VAVERGTIAVCGATGRQGGAVARALLSSGWHVRALTRKPDGDRAVALAEAGAEVIEADMEDPGSLRAAFDEARGVFSLQNGMISGFDHEVVQGHNVADAAGHAGVEHLVYASAGTDEADHGIPSWAAKRAVEAHMRSLGLPVTSIRPQALMELMTDKAFYPAVGTWRIWPKLMGDHRPVPWLAVADVGVIAAAVFSDPDRYVGETLLPVGDVQSLAECRTIYHEVMEKTPRTVPMPIWLFDRFTRKDVTAIWRWARTGDVVTDTAATRAIHPSALTVRAWLEQVRDQRVGGA
jgi:uncharacterized protein YbjT (DUF2867 family)